MAKKTKPATEQREKLAEMLRVARTGDARVAWLHALVLGAGYAPAVAADGESAMATLAQIARRMGVTERTVRSWVRKGLAATRPAHGNQPAWYDVFDFLRWYVERWGRRGSAGGTGAAGSAGGEGEAELSEAHWKTLCAMEDARRKKRENDLREGQLVEASRIGQDLAMAGQVFRRHAEAMAKAYGREVGEGIRDMLDEAERDWQASLRERAAEAARLAAATAEDGDEAKAATARAVAKKKARRRPKGKAKKKARRRPGRTKRKAGKANKVNKATTEAGDG